MPTSISYWLAWLPVKCSSFVQAPHPKPQRRARLVVKQADCSRGVQTCWCSILSRDFTGFLNSSRIQFTDTRCAHAFRVATFIRWGRSASSPLRSRPAQGSKKELWSAALRSVAKMAATGEGSKFAMLELIWMRKSWRFDDMDGWPLPIHYHTYALCFFCSLHHGRALLYFWRLDWVSKPELCRYLPIGYPLPVVSLGSNYWT